MEINSTKQSMCVRESERGFCFYLFFCPYFGAKFGGAGEWRDRERESVVRPKLPAALGSGGGDKCLMPPRDELFI